MQDGKVCDLKKKASTMMTTPSKPIPSKVVVATPSKSSPSTLKGGSTPKAAIPYAQAVKSGAKTASIMGPPSSTPTPSKAMPTVPTVPFFSPLL
jgi:hypothetical protein